MAAGAGAGASLGVRPGLLEALGALQAEPLLERTIPGTDERLPVVGLGGAERFAELALRESRAEAYETVGALLRTLVDGGGRVFDTAYAYGASEQVAGQVAEQLEIGDRVWWSTKVNAARVGGGVSERADPAATRYQIERSFLRLRRPRIDLLQVHNLGDPPTQLAQLRDLQAARYVRYVGVTTTYEPQHAALLDLMRSEPLDFIGIAYAADARAVEEEVLPLALERGIGVLVYMPFGRGRLWARIGSRPPPSWAARFDAHTWAQLLLKFVIAHPAVTAVCPGTSDPAHLADNLGAGRGRLPDPDERARIVDLVERLPAG